MPKFLDFIASKLGYHKEVKVVVQSVKEKKKDIISWEQIPEVSTYSPLLGESPPPWKTEDYLKAAVGWVYACESAICDEVAAIDLKLFQKKGEKVEEITEHSLLNLLYKVNQFDTKFDHWWLTQQYLEACGEAPWLVDRSGPDREPVAIYLLKPDRLTIKFDKQNVIGKYIYKPEATEKIEFEPDEIIFLKYPNPFKPFRGRGTLEAAAQTVDLDKYAEEWNVNFFYRAARPDIILKTEQKLTEEQRTRLRKEWERLFRGKEKTFGLAILESGLDAKPMGLSQKDMDFLAQQKFSRDKIFAIFRVPKSIVAISDDVNRANAETHTYVFMRNTIKPKMTRIIEQLNEFLVPMFGEDLYLDFEDPVPENIELKLQKYEKAGGPYGWMTLNEIRAEEELPPVVGGDSIYRPIAAVPAASTEEKIKGFVELSVEKDKEIKKKTKAERFFQLKAKSVGEIEVEKIRNGIKKIIKSYLKRGEIKKKVEELGVRDEELFWKKQITISEKYEKIFRSKLNDLFDGQEKEVLSKLEQTSKQIVGKIKMMRDSGSAVSPNQYFGEMKLSLNNLLLNVKKEMKKFITVLLPVVTSTIEDSGQYTLDSMGLEDTDFEMSEQIDSYLKKHPIKFSESINETTNDDLRKTLSEGITAGEGVDKLAKRVREVFKVATVSRSQAIARTETSRAVNFATVEAYKQSGVVKGKKWLTAFDERTCEVCERMNGKIVDVDDNFFDKNEEYQGITFDYDAVGQPPLHVSCRCTVTPVIIKS